MDLFQHITPETIVLTPNRRLSAVFLKNYSEWQIAQGKTCWNTLDILPLFPSWLERTWKEYAAREIKENSFLLTSRQEHILWEKILREDPDNSHLLQISDTAKLAKSASETLKRWKIDSSDSSLKLTENSRAFLNWEKKFKTICEKRHWISQNHLADFIIEKIQEKKIKPPPHILLVGFTEIPPQHQFLLKTCENHGTRISHYLPPSQNQKTQSIQLIDTENEILTMARWAKSLLSQSKSIGCIFPNLEILRERVIQIFSHVFEETHFNISAGKSLSSYPVIHTALQLLRLHSQTISINSLSNLLHSPFIGEAEEERLARSQFDNSLRRANVTSISFEQLINPDASHNLTRLCPALAKRIQNFLEKKKKFHHALPVYDGIFIFNELLSALGWPGERSLNSEEYQVIHHGWLPLLNECASMDDLIESQNYQTLLHYVSCLASTSMFQPESPDAPVQILGLLEAADIPFEHLWVMGLDDTTWPSHPKPNPFIPLSLQKSLNMPNASAERELIYCQQLTKQLQQSSKHLILSYPSQRDNTPLNPSSLLKNFETINESDLTLNKFISPAEKIFQSQKVEWLEDNEGPVISSDTLLTGGMSIFKYQAACPFKAFAELRLHAKKMQETKIGLRPEDRGSIIHKSLELIWNELKDSSTLKKLSSLELEKVIEHSAKKALMDILKISKLSRYLNLEITRLKKLLHEWLELEKTRPDFKVIMQESELTMTLHPISIQLRIDRIDEIAEGHQLIIDYKTSKNNECKQWFGDRLDEPQLPLYCLSNPQNITAIAFAQIHASRMELKGVSKAPLKMDSIKILSEIKYADATLWDEQLHIWKNHLTQLAEDFYAGKAKVDPKDPNLTCRQCDLKSLCRIHETQNDEF